MYELHGQKKKGPFRKGQESQEESYHTEPQVGTMTDGRVEGECHFVTNLCWINKLLTSSLTNLFNIVLDYGTSGILIQNLL